jgi:glycosyltransferase involved in cell wall biosynthesis
VNDTTVSICIPAYKADAYLAATLASVRAQSFTNWEIVLVEDGSRDSTEAIVQAFAREGPQPVHYFRHEKNQGLSATRNTGFAQSKTNLIAILDADDLWHRNHLRRSLDTFTTSNADLVFGGCELFDSATGIHLEQRLPPPGAMEEFPRSLHDGRVVIQPSTAVVKRSVIERSGGFSPQFPICNDLEFWFRLAREGCRFAYTGAVTCGYRKHGEALSKKGTDLAVERARIHHLYQDWSAIPAGQRRHELWRHSYDAAKMLWRRDFWGAMGLLWKGCPWRARK